MSLSARCDSVFFRPALLSKPWLRAAVVAALCMESAVWAQDAIPERGAAQWLQKIQTAGQRTNFMGTLVMQQGNDVRVSRIAHGYDEGVVRERVQALDGVPREFVRTNNEVRCLWPQVRKVVVEWRPTQDNFPALTDAAPAEVLSNYRFSQESVERVAGQDCQVIVLTPRDSLRYGHRLCVAGNTGLLLSAQVLNERNEVMERMAFTDIQVLQVLDRAVLEPSWATQDWRVVRTEHQPVDLQARGWFFSVPEGFRRVREVLRKMVGRKSEAHPSGEQAMQSVYSDGLATFSVFIEPEAFTAVEPPAEERIHVQGATHTLSRQVGRAAVTVVGEVPANTVRQVAYSVEYRGGTR